MVIVISEWERHFADEITLASFRRIQSLIGRCGRWTTIDVKEFTQRGLDAALDQLERETNEVRCLC